MVEASIPRRVAPEVLRALDMAGVKFTFRLPRLTEACGSGCCLRTTADILPVNEADEARFKKIVASELIYHSSLGYCR